MRLGHHAATELRVARAEVHVELLCRRDEPLVHHAFAHVLVLALPAGEVQQRPGAGSRPRCRRLLRTAEGAEGRKRHGTRVPWLGVRVLKSLFYSHGPSNLRPTYCNLITMSLARCSGTVRVPLIAAAYNSCVPILAASEPTTVAPPLTLQRGGGRLLRAPSLYPVPALGYPDPVLGYPDPVLGYPDPVLGYPSCMILRARHETLLDDGRGTPGPSRPPRYIMQVFFLDADGDRTLFTKSSLSDGDHTLLELI
eukprot:1918066-Pyramimonas_sp.AAC.1